MTSLSLPLKGSLTQTSPAISRSRFRLCLAIGAAVGAVIALWALAPQYILGSTGKWAHPENDLNPYLISWYYYIADQWRLPLFSLPAMGYPEGGNVLFNDGLPLTAIVTKALYKLSGLQINPFGWWGLAVYVLQGMMAARLVCAFGVRSMLAAVGAAVLAICYMPFLYRLGHVALSSHFLILWALALYVECSRERKLKSIEIGVLMLVAILVNSYQFVMVSVIVGATVIQGIELGSIRRADLVFLSVGAAIVAAAALISGYGVFVTTPDTMKASGFGFFSWNVGTLVVPPEALWHFPRHFVRDATGGQYEGESYVGLGALLLAVVCVVARPAWVRASVRRHAVLMLALTGLAVWAASNRVYFGRIPLLVYYLPRRVEAYSNYFRASGRFIWPLAYSIGVMSLAMVWRWFKPGVAVALTLLAIALQFREARPTLRVVQVYTASTHADMIQSDRLAPWLETHARVWQYPSWSCGGLAGPKREWGNDEANRELQLELLIARRGLPTNSVYTSRQLKNCHEEAAWGDNPKLAPGVLYLIGRNTPFPPALVALSASSSCVNLDWVTACSRSWGKPSD